MWKITWNLDRVSMSERSRRFRRFRRRTADDFNNRPAIIKRDGDFKRDGDLKRDGNHLNQDGNALDRLVDDRLTEPANKLTSQLRRKSIKRDREEDISVGNKVTNIFVNSAPMMGTAVF